MWYMCVLYLHFLILLIFREYGWRHNTTNIFSINTCYYNFCCGVFMKLGIYIGICGSTKQMTELGKLNYKTYTYLARKQNIFTVLVKIKSTKIVRIEESEVFGLSLIPKNTGRWSPIFYPTPEVHLNQFYIALQIRNPNSCLLKWHNFFIIFICWNIGFLLCTTISTDC